MSDKLFCYSLIKHSATKYYFERNDFYYGKQPKYG